MLRTFQYRIYPNRQQAASLKRLFDQAREVYNLALTQCENEYQLSRQSDDNPKMRLPSRQYGYFKEWIKQPGILLTPSVTATVLRRADKTYKQFFRDVKRGVRAGHGGLPKIRKRKINEYNTMDFQYGHGATWKPNATNPDRRVIRLTNIGDLKVRMHRPLPENAKIKAIQIARQPSGWYTSLQIEVEGVRTQSLDKPPVGIDMGLLRLLTLSDGTIFENPRWLRQVLRDIRIAQRTVSRRKKGSHRRQLAISRVARLHERIRRQRLDYWHKVTFALISQYGLIGIEDLTLGFMLRNEHLSRSAHDAGLGMFKMLLQYKAQATNVHLVTVDPSGTSQKCSRCGELVKKELNERVHRCPHCGLEIDRDLNAALNILSLALLVTQPNRLREAKQLPLFPSRLVPLQVK